MIIPTIVYIIYEWGFKEKQFQFPLPTKHTAERGLTSVEILNRVGTI